MTIRSVRDIVAWRLCVGCGACAYICPESNISLADVMREGVRPTVGQNNCRQCGECLSVCPGLNISHTFDPKTPDLIPGLLIGWGPVFETWEGYASDPEIRHSGSSGGLASALALYCIERGRMRGVLHVGPNEKKPLENTTVFSTNRFQILTRTGSRYSPASPCDSLEQIKSADGPCVFIGKPCDVVGLRKAQALKPGLDRNVGAAIGIFCAGTPSSQGTLDLLEALNVNLDDVQEIRYRGKGWPGKFTVRMKGEDAPRELLTYMDAWGFVQKYRPYRCYLCPDGTSEFADISCGDPWYRQIEDGEQGYSMVLVRTKRGRQILQGAIEEGYVVLERADPKILAASQKNLLAKRGAIWGRLLAMKAFGIPIPRYKGFFLFHNWLLLSGKEKGRSILGTVRRIIKRKYYKPSRCD